MSSSGEAPILEFRSVGYRTGGKIILSDINFTVRSGEVFVLLGPSGAGKTTILRLINRLLTETDGTVLRQGRPAADCDVIALRRQTGYVVQETGLFPHYTVEKNVALLPELLGKSEPEVSARVSEMLRLVSLEPAEFRPRYPHQLSGGQRQRVGVARALAGAPPILLMDEPFGALDPIIRAELRQEFKKLQERLNQAVVLVTHDLREALYLGTSIALMDSGRIVAALSPREFLASKDPSIAAYVEAFRSGDPFAAPEGNS